MITFRLAASQTEAKEIVEVLCDGEVCAAIYPLDDTIRIISAHMTATIIEDGRNSQPPIQAVNIAFAPEPYIIQHGSIIRHRR
jgi:hypothetical protein